MSKTLDKLIADLRGEDLTARRYAAQDLGDMRDTRAIPVLVDALASAPVGVQEACVDALLAIGGEATCRMVVALLYREEANLRNYAVEILSCIGPPAVPVVVPLCGDASEDIRKYAVDILARAVDSAQDPGFEAIVRCLADPNINVAGASAEALGRIGDPAAVPILLPFVSAEPWMQCCVVAALTQLDGEAGTQALASIDPETLAMEARAILQRATLVQERE